VLGIAGIDQQHLEAALIKDLESRNPVDAGGLHDHRPHPALSKPVGKTVQIAGERAEAAHRLGVTPWINRRHVHRGADVDRRRVRVNR
jgi:hypothetical protein